MRNTAIILATEGWVLRSGRARGADRAFEEGACIGGGPLSIGSPVELFTRQDSARHPEWYDHAAKFHPAWHRCDDYARSLHARNSPIILGEDLKSPVEFVICWTLRGELIGGTAQGLRIADACGIPVYNLGTKDGRAQMEKRMQSL